MGGVIVLANGGVAIVDDADIRMLRQYRWYGHVLGSGRHYAMANAGGKRVYMHRLLMRPSARLEVDHINGDSLDNRRCNLRVVTHQENQRNRRRGYGRTGVRNVYLTEEGRFKVRLSPKTGNINIGTFGTLSEASAAAAQARIAVFGRP